VVRVNLNCGVQKKPLVDQVADNDRCSQEGGGLG